MGTPNKRTEPTEPGVTAAGVLRSSAKKTPALILTQGAPGGWLLVAGGWARPDGALVDNEVMRKPKADERTGATLSDAVIRSLEAQLRGPARPIDWKKIEAIQSVSLLEAGIVLRSRIGAQSVPYCSIFGDCAVHALPALSRT
jgi:hypothetical protein